MTARNDRNRFYRLDDHGTHLADSIAYDAGYEIPQIATPDANTISFYYKSCNVNIDIENCDAKGHAEIKIWTGVGGGLTVALAWQDIRLLSPSSVQGLVKVLQSRPAGKGVDWPAMLEYCGWQAVTNVRTVDEPQQVGTKPETMKLDFRLWPVIQEDEPTTIFCPGGVGKSYLAVFCACLVQFDSQGFTDNHRVWTPKQGNVLYLDWESCHRDHQRRAWAVKRGLGIQGDGTFMYLRCTQPLPRIVTDIVRLVVEYDIKLVIVDSQMAASEFGYDQAQLAGQYYNALREIGCATLTLDHVSKAAMTMTEESTNHAGPYGSVVKYNRSRQQYELKKWPGVIRGQADLVMSHRKYNEGEQAEDFGIRLTFINDPTTGHLDRVTFGSFVVADHPTAATGQSIWKRLWDNLAEPQTLAELHEIMPDVGEASLKAILNKHKDKFAKHGDYWTKLLKGEA